MRIDTGLARLRLKLAQDVFVQQEDLIFH